MPNIFTSINTKFDPKPNVGIVKNTFDNVIDNTIYDDAACYEILTKKMREIMSDSNNTYINISGDRTISASTLSAINKYIDNKYTVIYIDSKPDLCLNNYEIQNNQENLMTNKDYRTSVVSNLLSLYNKRQNINDMTSPKRSYTKHEIDYNLNQFIFLGLHELNDYEESLFLNNNIQYYTLNKLNRNLDKIMDLLINDIKDDNIVIIFDLSVCNTNIAPLVIRDNIDVKNKCGLDLDQLNLILSKLSQLNKIKMIDITGHYLYVDDTEISYRITIETIIKIYSKLLKLKEYSINIFNENSKFLIYKPLDEIYKLNDEPDCGLHGWYLLRNMTLNMRNEILEELTDDESIIMFDIPKKYIKNQENDDNDDNNDVQIIIGYTNMIEQENKSYYTTLSYKDMILYPDEKIAMCFELTNLI